MPAVEEPATPAHTGADVAKMLDHAVLEPAYAATDLAKHAAMCFGCIGARSANVTAAVKLVAGIPVVVASVIGCPHATGRGLGGNCGELAGPKS